MDAHPVTAYKRVTMIINGVTKNVVVPVAEKDQGQNCTCESDTDDECIVITETDSPRSASPSESCQLQTEHTSSPSVNVDVEPLNSEPVCVKVTAQTDSCAGQKDRSLVETLDLDVDMEPDGILLSDDDAIIEQTDLNSMDLDVQPVEILPSNGRPVCDVVDLTSSPEKTDPAQNISTTCPVSRTETGIVKPFTLSSSGSHSTVCPSMSIVSSEMQPTPVPSATVFRNVIATRLQAEEAGVESYSQQLSSSLPHSTSVLYSETSTAPVLIAPQPSTEVSSISVITSPRTMTRQEAIAAGWFSDEERSGCLQISNATTDTRPTELPDDIAMLSAMGDYSVPATVNSSFVPSAELVSLENINVDANGASTVLAPGTGNQMEIIPLMSQSDAVSYSHISPGNAVKPQPELEIDVAVDRKPQLCTKDTKMFPKFEKFFNYDEDSCDYSRLMNEEDEPLIAVMEGIVNDKSRRKGSGKAKPAKRTTKKTEAVKRRPGRPPKLKPPKSHDRNTKKRINKAKRTGGRPLTPAERHRLNDCGVWLQQLKLPVAAVNIRNVWRCLCCRELIPPAMAESCGLCHGNRKSDGLLQLEAAREFRAGSRHCKKVARKRCEFSIDSDMLPPESVNQNVSESEKSADKKPPARLGRKSVSESSPPLQEDNKDKKYLLIRTETGTFVVPADSAVGCIVSEQDIVKMLCSQPALPSTSSAEFSKDTLLAACSQLEQSSHHKSASPSSKQSSSEVRKTSALSVGVPLCQTKAKTRLRSITKSGAVNRLSKKKLSNSIRYARRFSLSRELHALGIKASTTQHKITRTVRRKTAPL